MDTPRYPLATATWDQAEYDAMQRVIDAGMFTMGERVHEFEKLFAEYVGSRHAVMVNSGSSANLLMVAALCFTRDDRLKPSDEVIVPAVSWSTTYYPLHQYGLKLRFVDIDLETLNYDLEQLSAAITDRTRLVMVVNLLGNPNDFNAIELMLDGLGIRYIEDNCESMGAQYRGKQAGTFGLMGSFSTFFSHHISTMEGGLIVTDDDELHHILLSLRAHGWTRNLPKQNLVCGDKSDDPFTESFRFVLPGYNLRPLELSGAIGVEQLKKRPAMIEMRRRNGAALTAAFKGHPDILVQKEIGQSSWFGFSLVSRPGSALQRPEILKRLVAAGFECRPIVAGNFAKNEVMKHMDAHVVGDLPNADHIDKQGLFVGNHHYDISEALTTLREVLS